ncbi:RagB/SusD family nutrient uptake outer membrane protein [uncultured Algibacter sp.]|uniref:RagB/SusD family nutrient uptake outer membrane protein n=1 Tax=uncultured Algibacter sp. TaxID=298659 RepID=UPI003217940F
MKKYKHYLVFGITCMVLTVFSSCELSEEIDDFEPLFSLPSETGISDENSAELALTGVYARLRREETGPGIPDFLIYPSILSGVADGTFFGTFPSRFFVDEFQGAAFSSDGIYTKLYDLINRANLIIEKVPQLDNSVFTNVNRKEEIVGEAKILRAMGYFYLLRTVGQFYDTNSNFGVSLRTDPPRTTEISPRSSVADTYSFILQDLDDALVSAPDLRAKFFTNKTFAKGLKAKVMLYQGNYAEAANLANEILTNPNPNFTLAPTYDELFINTSPQLFDNPEILFGPKGEPGAELGIGFNWGLTTVVNGKFLFEDSQKSMDVNGQIISYDGNRVSNHFGNQGPFGLDTEKYIGERGEGGNVYEILYILRMAEVYLIFAEANARNNNSVTTEALNALNAVRIRSGATTTGGNGFETYPATISLQQFLEAVRIEKMIEMAGETGEEWFDLVRYDYADGFGTGFQVSDVVPTATNPDFFILRIEQNIIDRSNNIIVQNPGYDF